ncbi:MAG: DNA polymerase I [Anaerolineales bacterium]
MSREKLMLIDGHSLAYRAYHALPDTIKTSGGEPTNATYGFTSMLLSVLEEEQPDYAIVTFDKGPSFRVEIYPEYKAHREKMPDEMHQQMQRIREVVAAFGLPRVELEKYEADDLLGTLSRQAAEAGLEVIIVTGDRDALQLVTDHITVLTSGRRFSDTQHYTPEKVRQKYDGLRPDQLIDHKALMGDRSDNIPGVYGVGEKGAVTMLKTYGTLDEIYAHLDELSTRYRNALEKGREDAYLSRDLGRIRCDAPVELDLEAARLSKGFDHEAVMGLMQTLEFRSLLKRLPALGIPIGAGPSTPSSSEDQLSLFGEDLDEAPAAPDADYHLIDTEAALAALVAQLHTASVITIDTETTSTDALQADLVGIAITDRAGEAWYLPIQAPAGATTLSLASVQEQLGPLLFNAAIPKRGHNLKYDLEVLARHDLPVKGQLYDTMIAAWLITPDSRNLGLKDLAWKRLGVQMTEINQLIGAGKSQTTMDHVPVTRVLPYAAADADLTHRLAEKLRPELEKRQLLPLFHDLEMPLAPVLVDMELNGVKIDTAQLEKLSQELRRRLHEIQEEIYRQAGTQFNINSTQQLSEVLFDHLGLPKRGVPKTKSGHYTTRASVLERLKKQHPLVAMILDYRELAKLKSTYIDALAELVNPETGRIHTSYNQTGTVTGRLSSSNPNLQNIPIRTEEGRRVRSAFVSEEGWLLVGADYSQVELRVMAHVSEDEGLIEAFRRGEDIHTTTAAAVYGAPQDEVTYEMRRIAKAVNFGLIYGQGAYGLARQIDVKPKEAETFITRYFERFPRVQSYMKQIEQQAEEYGYVETLLHRRRYFPELAPGSRTSHQLRQAARRMAINTPIQGTAADIIKLAMLRTYQELRANNLRTRMILQVHDEIVLEAPEDEREIIIPLLRAAMEGAFTLKVPLKVDIEIGTNWNEMTPVED